MKYDKYRQTGHYFTYMRPFYATKHNRKILLKGFNRFARHSSVHSSHSIHVARTVRGFAKFLNIPSEIIVVGSIAHDFGKMKVPSSILHKPEKLTPDERRLMDTHPAHALRFLEQLVGELGTLARVLAVYHHLTYNQVDILMNKGTLTPFQGTAVKILTISDIFDGLIDPARTYHIVRGRYDAIELMKQLNEPDPILLGKFETWQRRDFTNEFRSAFIERQRTLYHHIFQYCGVDRVARWD